MKPHRLLIGGAAFLAALVAAAGSVRAADGVKLPEITKRPFTILRIVRYDGTTSYEVLKSNEMGIRAREIYAEYPIWEEAHRRARIQWAQWFAEKIPENAGREWVLPKPKPPRFGSVGVFQDEFDAEEKVKSLNRTEQAKMARIKKQLRQNARYSKKAVAYLSNLEENRKLLRELIPEVHEALLAQDRAVITRMSEKKKKTIWNLAHIAQQKAEKKLREKTVDENKKPVEPDVVDLYNALHDAIEPILKRYKIKERQWYMVWEDGYMNEWSIPKIEEEEKIQIVAAEVDKEQPPEEAGEEKPKDPEQAAAEAKSNLDALEGDMGLEDLGDVKLNTPPKPVKEPEKKPAAEGKEKKDEKEPEKPEEKKVLRRDWW